MASQHTNSQQTAQSFEFQAREGLREDIGDVVMSPNSNNRDISILHLLPNEMVPDIDVFSPWMECSVVLRKRDRSIVVTEDG
jgi:hypothetical protein